jgi:hypothetical protein
VVRWVRGAAGRALEVCGAALREGVAGTGLGLLPSENALHPRWGLKSGERYPYEHNR